MRVYLQKIAMVTAVIVVLGMTASVAIGAAIWLWRRVDLSAVTMPVRVVASTTVPAASRTVRLALAQESLRQGINAHELEQVIHRIVNEEREVRGLSTLAWDNALAGMARGHSQAMVQSGFSHTLDGCDLACRAVRYRYHYSIIAENLFMISGFHGSNDILARRIVDAWLASEGHRHNVLMPSVMRHAVGVHITPYGRSIWVTENFSASSVE